MKENDVINFFFELGMLRKTKHQGIRLIGVENPESVAEHSLRAAQIGYVLARMENYPNPFEVCTLVVFHDIGECRVGDLSKLNARYVEVDEARAVLDQTCKLNKVGEEINQIWVSAENRSTTAAVIAKDADYLEQAIAAKEYMEIGFLKAEDWINNVEKVLKTESAKRLLKELKKSDSNDWWQGLKYHKDFDDAKKKTL